jgi:hypothetical protein
MWRKQKRDNKQRTNSRSTTQSLEDNEQEFEDEKQGDHLHHHHQDNINASMHTENSILSHSMPMLSPSSSRNHQMVHHEYNPSMPPYMQHSHPSLMSHPPPPPPPPPPSAHWMNRSHHPHSQYHHAAEFMPPGY